MPPEGTGGQWTDLNGDGKSDYVTADIHGKHFVSLSTGEGYINQVWDGHGISLPPEGTGGHWADLNGDGKSDYFTSNIDGRHHISISTGDGYEDTVWPGYGIYLPPDGTGGHLVDINGDGMLDFATADKDGNHKINLRKGYFPDLIYKISIDNGGTTLIRYSNSSEFDNILLPFVLHTVSSITTDDQNGVLSSTKYKYEGGLYDFEDREFRGFKSTTQIQPNGTDVKIVFFQGKRELIDPEDEGDNYFLKGRVNYEESRQTFFGTLFSRTDMTYGQRDEGNGSEFVFLSRKLTKTYDNGRMVLETHTNANIEDYDDVGNLKKSETWDTGGTAEKIIKSSDYANYGTETDPLWRKTMEKVEGAQSGVVRQSWYRYTDDDRANLEEKELWNDQGDNPIINYAYDDYGNVEKQWDARSNPSTDSPNVIYEYDPETHTYPVKVTDALGHLVEIGWDLRFGKKNWTGDANGIVANIQYDEFGRPVQAYVTDQNDNLVGCTFTEYHLDTQPRYVKKRVLENQSPESYIESYQYIDGFGRTIQTISTGIRQGAPTPVVTRTVYDSMGRVRESWGPYFGSAVTFPSDPIDSDVPKSWTDYDFRSRPSSFHVLDKEHGELLTLYSYNGLNTTVIDPDGAKKKTTKDYLGRVREVVEFSEDDELHTLYDYNAAGDLLTVKNPLWIQNDPDNGRYVTTITYDTLGRKRTMTDPDMGHWEYRYDLNGNLKWQKDADNKEIVFDYDELNRVKAKRYLHPTTGDLDVTYTYDDVTTTTTNAIGHLSKVTNGIVTETYDQYDALGQALSVTNTIRGDTPRNTQYTYDMAGRPLDLIYPDAYHLKYNYHPGTRLLQSTVSQADSVTHATFNDYAASGKTKKVVYGNKVTSEYIYDPLSDRLEGFHTQHPTHGELMNRAYTSTPAGDIESIDDVVTGNTRFYEYDKLHRLTSEHSSVDDYSYLKQQVLDFYYDQGKPLHAVSRIDSIGGSQEFLYDANGNMTSGADLNDADNPAKRTITYNSNNMPVTIDHSINGVTTFVYDGNNSRAKKSGSNGTVYYYGPHFENHGGRLVKYIFAGGQRVAVIKDGKTHYFHNDHLGSSSIITNAAGAKVQETDYLPFGGQRGSNTITVSNYGFTDQERDPESGLYNYNARLYDPALGVFISSDSIVPDPYGPQSMNKYGYCINNPLVYIDPSGHSWLSDVWGGIEKSFDGLNPVSAYEKGGYLGLFLHSAGPGTDVLTYTYSGGFATSHGWNYGLFDFGGGWQERGPNAGAYGYIGFGYSIKGFSAGLHFRHNQWGDYSLGVSAGYKGMSAGYGYSSTTGDWGWNVGASAKGFNVNYNFNNDSWQGSADLRVVLTDAGHAYAHGRTHREFGGYGPDGGNPLYTIVDFIGAVTMTYIPADNHDKGWSTRGRSKSTSDAQFLRDNLAGGFANIKSGRVVQGAIGIVIGPIYYAAVAYTTIGREAYDNAQRKAQIRYYHP
jgi:RHS repeat-associated protein